MVVTLSVNSTSLSAKFRELKLQKQISILSMTLIPVSTAVAPLTQTLWRYGTISCLLQESTRKLLLEMLVVRLAE
jgi:hypothetical protein